MTSSKNLDVTRERIESAAKVGAVRELCPRGMPGMVRLTSLDLTSCMCWFHVVSWQEEAVQAGVANNGMGPIAQKLTQQEVPCPS